MILPAYSSKNVSLAWGDITFEGLAPDFFTITPNSNITTTSVGADGARAPTLSPDYSCTVSLTLQQTSPTNRKLDWVLNEQRRQRGLAVMNFSIDDPSGSLLTLLKDAYFEEGPEQGFTSEAGERVWTWNAELNYDELASGIEFSASIATAIESEVNAAISLAFNI